MFGAGYLDGSCWRSVICGGLIPCSKSSGAPPRTPIPERLGWDQRATDAAQLASSHYAILVDGVRSVLDDVSCATTTGPNGFACTAAFPQMSEGVHTLKLVTFTPDGLESAPSAPFSVNLVITGSANARLSAVQAVASATPSDLASRLPSGLVVTTSDHVQLRLDLVVDGLDEPTDVAFAPNDRVFIAERAGRVRVVDDGHLQPQPASTLDDVVTTGDGGLLAVVLDSQFEQTHFVYLIYTRSTRSTRSGESVFCLARFREANDTLADRVILLDNISASPTHPSASLRFGPDGKLYAAFDDGGDARRAGDMGSFNGKILRLKF